jgi:hypothetical protein
MSCCDGDANADGSRSRTAKGHGGEIAPARARNKYFLRLPSLGAPPDLSSSPMAPRKVSWLEVKVCVDVAKVVGYIIAGFIAWLRFQVK